MWVGWCVPCAGRRLDADLAIIDKRRPQAGVSEVMNIIGDVSDRHCIMVDDIDSGGTLAMQQALMDADALSVDAYAPWCSVRGRFTCSLSPLTSVTTDSIQATEAPVAKYRTSVLLGEAVAINEEKSVSSLFL